MKSVHPFRTSTREGSLTITKRRDGIHVHLECTGGRIKKGKDAAELHDVFEPLVADLRTDPRLLTFSAPGEFVAFSLWQRRMH